MYIYIYICVNIYIYIMFLAELAEVAAGRGDGLGETRGLAKQCGLIVIIIAIII